MTGSHPDNPAQVLVHGCCLDVGGAGVLLLGPPASGKSDLALRLVDQPGTGLDGTLKQARLVADDQVEVARQGTSLIASAPLIIAGRMEVRGLGLVSLPHRGEVKLSFAVRLSHRDSIERLPDIGKSRFECLGVSLPMILIDPSTASAPARIRAAVDWLRDGAGAP